MSSVVIKIGSSSVVNKDFSVNRKNMNSLLYGINALNEEGVKVALVTSGAIACGMNLLGIKKKIKNIPLRQACAAVGQSHLMLEYSNIASIYGITTGQILVSHDDFKFPHRMKCLKDTLAKMFDNNVLPIINENDALAVEEIKFGDNDTLASFVAPLVKAELVVLFSDVDGLYDSDPRVNRGAKLIKDVWEIDDKIVSLATGSSTSVGTGGMVTKITSAKHSTDNGADLIICNANKLDSLREIVSLKNIGTLFHSKKKSES